ncbi:hypothetical protein WBJ53_14805 [Spirosoma sp. SC4-14]|uniref:hypothetical protein n=1 Tax=Spirosoma sp. SC4-14 TaxID=3128900 RepID=UPI0030CDFFC3
MSPKNYLDANKYLKEAKKLSYEKLLEYTQHEANVAIRLIEISCPKNTTDPENNTDLNIALMAEGYLHFISNSYTYFSERVRPANWKPELFNFLKPIVEHLVESGEWPKKMLYDFNN